MRTPGRSDEEEPPGGRALQRLQQFEQARGYDQTEVPGEQSTATDDQPDDPCADQRDETQQDGGNDVGSDAGNDG